jgi:3D (Asp-Asp-Asp) domain-containing protein
MQHAKILLTVVTLLVTSLSLTGCVGSRSGQMADQTSPRPVNNPQEDSSLGRLDDPKFVFGNRLPVSTKSLTVNAMAYTSCSPKKSKRTPQRAPRGAWGDTLTPDVKAVAVSPDLLEMGLDRGDVIKIEGLPGEYKVLDVMHSRHDKTIDIFYGNDKCGAMEWGKRTLTINWQ